MFEESRDDKFKALSAAYTEHRFQISREMPSCDGCLPMRPSPDKMTLEVLTRTSQMSMKFIRKK